jgi:tetratricopeptide (TPR) repeat protein
MNRLLALACATALVAGCASNRDEGPYRSTGTQRRDVPKAEKFYQEAKPLLVTDTAQAEDLLRKALAADIYHGGAHNNLGVLLLQQERLYDAAEEFEWARKLLPGNPEPRVNLALVLDRAGRASDALDAAKTALEVMPGNLPAIQLTALIQVRDGSTDQGTVALLNQISMRSDQSQWRAWAVAQRDKLGAQPQP